MTEKKCSRCLLLLPIQYFSMDGKRYRSECKQCHAAAKRQNRRLNPESDKAAKQRYYAKNREKVRAANKAWRSKNREYVREKMAAWYQANKEQQRDYKRQWSLENPTDPKRARAAKERYKQKHGERFLLMQRQWSFIRKARKRLLDSGIITPEMIQAILLRQKNRCVYCQKRVGKKYHCDHIIALSKGGPHSIENIQVTCPSCNVRKWAKDPVKFANSIGLLF